MSSHGGNHGLVHRADSGERAPTSVVWTTLPGISTLIPMIGHVGVGDSIGITYDFSGPYQVSVGSLMCGPAKRVWRLSLNKMCHDGEQAVEDEIRLRAYDAALQKISLDYCNRMHNLVLNNCHSHVASVLNEIQYDGRNDWNQFRVFLSLWRHGRLSNRIRVRDHRCRITASYLQPAALTVDFTSKVQSGNFGAVFFGRYDDPEDEGISQDVVIKCPMDSKLSQQLYDMERHTNMKLSSANLYPRRFPYYLGEMSFSQEQQLPLGIARTALVWRRVQPAETLELYLSSASLESLANILGTTASANPLRRPLCATILRELALTVNDLQANGIIHRDIKPENLLVVDDSEADAPLQVIDFGSSCDWNTLLKKGLRLATCDPIYSAPERRLDIFKPAYKFDVYSIALIALRVALPSLTNSKEMENFVESALSKNRGSLAKVCESVMSGRIHVPSVLRAELSTLDSPENQDMFAILATMLTETPEDRADVSDCLNSRFVRSNGL